MADTVIQTLIEQKIDKYKELLGQFDPEVIKSALEVLRKSRNEIKQTGENLIIDVSKLDGKTREVFELMTRFKQDIKQIFKENKRSTYSYNNSFT